MKMRLVTIVSLALGLLLYAQQTSTGPVPHGRPSTRGSDLTVLLYSYPNNSKQEMLVTDPLGKSAGKNALTGKQESSATNASYSLEGQGDLDDISTPVVKSVRFVNPAAGTYKLRVTAKATGHFDLYVTGDCDDAVGRKQLQVRRQQIDAGGTQAYSVHFEPTDCGNLTLTASTPATHEKR